MNRFASFCQPKGKQVQYTGKTTIHYNRNVLDKTIMEFGGKCCVVPGSQEVIGSYRGFYLFLSCDRMGIPGLQGKFGLGRLRHGKLPEDLRP